MQGMFIVNQPFTYYLKFCKTVSMLDKHLTATKIDDRMKVWHLYCSWIEQNRISNRNSDQLKLLVIIKHDKDISIFSKPFKWVN